MISNKQLYISVLTLFLLGMSACKKFTEVAAPKTQIPTSIVFSDDNTAIAAMMGVYAQMSGASGNFVRGGYKGLSSLTALSADEFRDYSNNSFQKEFYNNALTPINSTLSENLWAEPFRYIFSANSILEGVANSQMLSPAVQKQLKGEARFIRAFSYFYLVNLYGAVPLILHTDYAANASFSRTPGDKVYDQIVTDLMAAKQLLPADFAGYKNERARPCKYAAGALLARVYLYRGIFDKAALEADSIIARQPLFQLLNNPDSVFLKNSSEAIWQLSPVIPSLNTQDGFDFILAATPSYVALSENAINAFEAGDKRKSQWTRSIFVGGITYNYPYKYKVQSGAIVSEYAMIMRLAELYLIRSEARAQQGLITGSQADINLIRARAGLLPVAPADKAALLLAIEHERQVELMTEWGHRWFDLRRFNRLDAVLSPIKSPNWQSSDAFYPIPESEINIDPNLQQNPGY